MASEVYNVGGHNEKQNIEIVKIICKELGKPESLITHVGDRKGHDILLNFEAEINKVKAEIQKTCFLGWKSERSEEAVRHPLHCCRGYSLFLA